jgi:ACR3 family arsenite efflux pump ArsB
MNAVFNLGTRINRSLGRYSLLAMMCGILLGATGDYPWLKRLIPAALFLMLYPAMLDVEIGKIKEGIANPTLLAMALAVNFGLAPLVMFGMVHLYGLAAHPLVLVGITLFGIVPCGGMVPAYTGMLRGNVSLSVAITAVSLLLSIGIVPLWAKLLIGRFVPVPLSWMVSYLAMIVVVPVLAADVTRRWAMKMKGPVGYNLIKDRLKALTGYGLMLMVLIIFTLKGRLLINQPLLILRVMLPVSSFLLILLLSSHLFGRVAGSTYEEVAIALAASVFPPEVVLVIGVAGPLVQLPVMLTYLKWKTAQKQTAS